MGNGSPGFNSGTVSIAHRKALGLSTIPGHRIPIWHLVGPVHLIQVTCGHGNIHKYLKHSVLMFIMIHIKIILGLADLIKRESESQLTNKVAFLVFNWSASPTSPPGVVRHHLGLYLGIIPLLLFFFSSFTLLSFFDLDTRKAGCFKSWCTFSDHFSGVQVYVSLLVLMQCISLPMGKCWLHNDLVSNCQNILFVPKNESMSGFPLVSAGRKQPVKAIISISGWQHVRQCAAVIIYESMGSANNDQMKYCRFDVVPVIWVLLGS